METKERILNPKQKAAQAETTMLIRKPVREVFEAFINPEITTKFWFTRSSGKLEKGKRVTWTWEMYDVTSDVLAKEIIRDKKIEIEWSSKGEAKTRVEWTFNPIGKDSTVVTIIMDGFKGNEEYIREQVADAVGGFCWVLAGLKAYLEHDIQLNLIADRFPKSRH